VFRLYYRHQSRMTSNGIAITPSHSYNAVKWVGWGMGGGVEGSACMGGWLRMCLGDASVRCVLGWCCVFVTMLPDTIDDSRTSTRGLYFRPSQLCSLKRIRNFKGLFYLNLGYSYSSFFYFGNVVVSSSQNVHGQVAHWNRSLRLSHLCV
jgi:hypothetical protein